MKVKLNAETQLILADLRNRINQLIEANQHYISEDTKDLINHQEKAFWSVLALIDQIEETGQIYRGNDYFPDSLEPLASTKWKPQTKLI